MEILIISLPRTGSTSLSKKISEENNLTLIGEPFNDFKQKTPYLNENYVFSDCVLKTNIFHKPHFISHSERVEWLINFSKKFTKTILLTRKDLQSCIESWAFYNYKAKERKLGHDIHYYWEKTPNYEKAKNDIICWNDELKFLSEKLNIPITYYEDNFDPNSKERLRLGDLKINKLI